MPQNAASDQGLQCLALNQQFSDTSKGNIQVDMPLPGETEGKRKKKKKQRRPRSERSSTQSDKGLSCSSIYLQSR